MVNAFSLIKYPSAFLRLPVAESRAGNSESCSNSAFGVHQIGQNSVT